MSDVGKMVISLDTEIAWGRISDPNRTEFYPLFSDARAVIDKQLELFDKYNIPVTWALVGRLIESFKDPTRYIKDDLAGYFPNTKSTEVYADDKLNSVENSYLHYSELVQKIRNCNAAHELASHTYNHCFFDDVIDPSLIVRDFEAMKCVSSSHGFNPTSLVFPKNQVNHLDLVAKNGITIYRSQDEHWYDRISRSGVLRKLLRQFDLLSPVAALDIAPSRDEHGVWRLPGSIVFRREHRGVKRHLPMSLLSRKTIRALDRCVTSGRYVHLWWHPFNFAYRPEAHLRELENVLVHAAQLRESGSLEVLTMKNVSDSLGK